MSDSSRDVLRQRLLLDYNEIKAGLARRLGSVDQASDALHDTWIRLEEIPHIGAVERQPVSSADCVSSVAEASSRRSVKQ